MDKWYEQNGPESDVVVSTCIRLNRNLRELPFPIKMSRSDRALLMEKVLDAAKDSNIGDRYKMQFIEIGSLSKTETVSLVERQLASPDFISDTDGRGILLSADESVSILLNAENHLQLQVMSSGLNLTEAYAIADELDTILDKTLHFAFDENLGYLAQNPVNLGTGLSSSLSLHLPALKENGGAARLTSNLSKLGLSMHGAHGAGSEPKGAIYRLTNQVSLGLSEQEAITNLKSIAMQIVEQERSARQELAENMEVRDTVCRSLGILQSACMMSNDEFMNLISNVRFGVSVGLVTDISYEKIDKLAVEVQPATLLVVSGKKLTVDERHILRAKKIKETLK